MHLQNHSRGEATLFEHPVQPYHSEFYQVCRRALDGGIDCDSLRLRTRSTRLRIQLGQVATASVHRRYVACRTRDTNRIVEPCAHAGKPLEVALDVVRGLRQRNPEFACQPLRPHPVDNPKVYHLGQPPRFSVDLVCCDSEHLSRGADMNILAGSERIDESPVARQMCHHAQIDLRIVGGDEDTSRLGYERAANPAALDATSGDVLQIRIARTDASSRHQRLMPCRMN